MKLKQWFVCFFLIGSLSSQDAESEGVLDKAKKEIAKPKKEVVEDILKKSQKEVEPVPDEGFPLAPVEETPSDDPNFGGLMDLLKGTKKPLNQPAVPFPLPLPEQNNPGQNLDSLFPSLPANNPNLPPPPPPVTKPKKDMAVTAERDLRYQYKIVTKPVPLRGIMLIKDPRGGQMKSNAKSIQPSSKSVDGVFVSPALFRMPEADKLKKKLASTYIDDPDNPQLTYGELEKMVKEIHEHYIDNGHPLVHVYVPTQKISDSIQIAVLEGQIKPAVNADDKDQKKEAEDGIVNWWNGWYNRPYDTDALVAKINDDISKEPFLQPKGLQPIFSEANKSPWDRLNRKQAHPFLDIKPSLTPYKKDGDFVLGQTQLNVRTEQKRPLRFFVGYDNSLTDLLGNHRIYAGAVWYDAFALNLNHQLSFQIFSGSDFSSFAGLAAGYHIPWEGEKHFSDFYLSYVNTEADVISAGIPTTIGGSSLNVGGMHWYRLPDLIDGGEIIPVDQSITKSIDTGDRRFYRGARKNRQTFGIYHEIGAGLDFKLTDNTLEFGSTSLPSDSALLSQLVLGYTARQTDRLGETNLRWKGYVGLGGSDDTEMNALRVGAEPNYFYTRLDIDRETDLPFGALLKNRLIAQVSTENLLASEQLSMGGSTSVRGYAERAYRADNGLLFSTELYSPAFHPLTKFTDLENISEELRFLAFFDLGVGGASDERVASDISQTLMSAGIGLRYAFEDDFSFRLDYGIPLEDLDSPPFDEDFNDPRVHVGGVWTF